MKMTLWGTRGSVPVWGSRFIRHGGATTCVELELDRAAAPTPSRVIIDCGTGLAELGKSRRVGDALFLQTHMHWDHIQGFPFFGPFFDPSGSFEFWSVDRDSKTLREVLADQMSLPRFPVGLDATNASMGFCTLSPVDRATLGELELAWTELCHPSGSTGFRLTFRGRSIVFTGDVEVEAGCRRRLVDFARGADVLVMDAQYFPDEYASRKGWGHSTAIDAVDVAVEAGVDTLLLTHHDPAHDDERLDAKRELARHHAAGRVQVDNAHDRMTLTLATPSQVSASP